MKQKYKSFSPFTVKELLPTLSAQVSSTTPVSNKELNLLLHRYLNPKLCVSNTFLTRLKQAINKQQQGCCDNMPTLLESLKELGNRHAHFVDFTTVSSEEMIEELIKAEKARL